MTAETTAKKTVGFYFPERQANGLYAHGVTDGKQRQSIVSNNS